MSTDVATDANAEPQGTARVARGPWRDAWRRLRKDRLAMVCFVVIAAYAVLGILTGLGVIAADANLKVTERSYEGVSWREAWAHLAWPGQALLSALLCTVPVLPVCYLWLGRGKRFWITAAGLFGAALVVAGAGHAIFGPEPVAGHEDHSFTRHLAGADFFGRNIWSRMLAAIPFAFKLGVIVTAMAIPIGLVLGAIAGYFGGLVDELIVWLYSTLASIPGLLLILAMGFALRTAGVNPNYVIYFALGTTTWITLCRLIRGEVLKHKSRDYVLAARALGAGHARCLGRHIVPNVLHIVIIRFSLQFVYAIETEVVLSFLGLGPSDFATWGQMIDASKLELTQGVFGNLFAATAALFGLALAFNVLGDSLRDALDPRLNQ